MRPPPGILWRFFGAGITLAPPDHADLDRLYKLRRLPLVPTPFPGDGGVPPPRSPVLLAKCIQSFEALPAVSLLKAQSSGRGRRHHGLLSDLERRRR